MKNLIFDSPFRENFVIQLSKLSTHLDLQNEPIFIPLFKRESTQNEFWSSQFFPLEPIIKIFSKNNFTAFPTELRENFLSINEDFSQL
jgi:hypothetical protein